MVTKCMQYSPIIRFFVCLLFAIFLLGACDTGSTNNNAPSPSPTASTTARPLLASAILKHTPSGTATFSWDEKEQILTVRVVMTGLVAGSIHPTEIHAGSCSAAGVVIYPLQDSVANDHGNEDVTSSIKEVDGGIPVAGWYIEVHNGPQSADEGESLPISCGNIANPQASALANQSVQVTLAGVSTPNQAVKGTAELTLTNGSLTVTVKMSNLVANSTHAVHIQDGTCDSEGQSLYDLKPITGNAIGNGTSISVLPHITTIPENTWYITIHLTTDMSTQTTSDLIACGNVLIGALG